MRYDQMISPVYLLQTYHTMICFGSKFETFVPIVNYILQNRKINDDEQFRPDIH